MSNYRAHIEKSEISGMPTATFEGRIITIDTVADTDKAVTDGLNDAPYRSALKGSGGLGYERPYLCQLVVPS